jgi:hypothetical protein
MTSHNITIAGYLLILLAALVLEGLSRRPGSQVPSFQDLMTRIMGTRSGRVGVLAAWAWLGLHLFAR